MKRVSPFPTSFEEIVLDQAFEHLGESRLNRTMSEYLDIANRLPSLKKLHAIINERLKTIHKENRAPYRICRFKAGDERIVYEEYPRSLSIQVVRTALNKSGMRMPRRRASR